MTLLNKYRSKKIISIYLPSFDSSGITRLYFNLIPFFIVAGFSVILVVDVVEGNLKDYIPEGVKVIEFRTNKFTKTFPLLLKFLRDAKPDIVISAHKHKNIIIIWAMRILKSDTIHVLTNHTPVYPSILVDRSIGNIALPILYKLFVRYADCLVAVSNGIADELRLKYVKNKKINVILNGVITDDFNHRLGEQYYHPWLIEDRTWTTFVSIGRLEPEKDFETLLISFADFLRQHDGRLIIFGEGRLRNKLQKLIIDKGISDYVDLPGFVENILPALRMSNAFVMSSIIEGWPLALAEAIAVGVSSISTDCPYGPSEILEEGKFGILVPVEDWRELSLAMSKIVEKPFLTPDLQGRGKNFTVAYCAKQYLELFDRCLSGDRG